MGRARSGLLSMAVALAASTGCAPDMDSRLEGVWYRADDHGRRVDVQFLGEGVYLYRLKGRSWEFTGEYTWDDETETMTLVDRYCGTGLPGTYRVGFRRDSLIFTALDDKYCDRRMMLDGPPWYRVDPAEVDDTAGMQRNPNFTEPFAAESNDSSEVQ